MKVFQKLYIALEKEHFLEKNVAIGKMVWYIN